jgi:hypothetical protein
MAWHERRKAPWSFVQGRSCDLPLSASHPAWVHLDQSCYRRSSSYIIDCPGWLRLCRIASLQPLLLPPRGYCAVAELASLNFVADARPRTRRALGFLGISADRTDTCKMPVAELCTSPPDRPRSSARSCKVVWWKLSICKLSSQGTSSTKELLPRHLQVGAADQCSSEGSGRAGVGFLARVNPVRGLPHLRPLGG